jgi:sigma-B regulation protein RsbU (phosphoserine phosphatase)
VCGRAGRSSALEICNAGHTPAVWVRNGQPTKLEATGVPLGLFSSVDYPTQSIELARGDTLFLYTDGLTETHSARGEEYGEDRLMKVLESSASLSPKAILQACIEDAQQFRADEPASDDLAMMAIRRVE